MSITKLIFNVYNMWNKPVLGKSVNLKEVELFQGTLILLDANRSILSSWSLHSPTLVECFVVANLSFFSYVI